MSDNEFDFNDDSDYSGGIYSEAEDEPDDFEDPGYGEEPGPSKEATSDDDYPFEVLSTENIVDHMVECIREVNSVIQIPTTTVRILLNHFKWDKEKLMERYYSDEQDKLYEEAKIVPPSKKIANKVKALTAPAKSINADCDICTLSFPKHMMTGLDCCHCFCTSCWTQYLSMKIIDEGASQSIFCPEFNCQTIVDDETVIRLVKDPRTKSKYQQLITNSFVHCNRLMRWCSAPNCSYAVKVSHVEARPVKCRCGHSFCFACGENWHDPVRCHLIKKWIKKCDDDSETSNWISANTKECPKCGAVIEKDGGCNHMICKNQACKADFCWVCLGPWEPHGSSWYNCNRYDEEEARSAREGQEKSRAALTRYLFYCNRYMNHLQSLKFENKLYTMVKEKMDEMQQHNMSWIEVQFLKKAVDILCECRRTLMYTYVFAYYLRKNNQCEIFEDNQKDLEQATEMLSEYLERDICETNLIDIKQKVQDKYRYCDGRRKALLEHVHEGYEKELWLYTEPDC